MKDKPRKYPLRIAVTGAAGFIGQRVVARLAEARASVVAVDRLPEPVGLPDGVQYRCADLSADVDAIPPADVLVHLAWDMNRDDSGAQAKSVEDFRRLLEQGNWRGVVGLGSAEEYGELEGRLSEDMVPGLKLSAYGQAKHEAGLVLEAWSRGAGRKAAWLRPFVVYGPEQGGTMAIPYALRCAKDRIAADFSEGHQFRDFVHLDDVADGIVRAALGLADVKLAFAVCNLGRGEPVRLRDVLERIAEQTGSQERFHYGTRPMRPDEPKTQYADITAAAALLGWRAQISWEQGIEALCKELRKGNHG